MPPLARPTRPRHQPTWRGVRAAHREHQGAARRGRRHGPEAEADERGEAPQPERHAQHDRADADPDRDGEALPQDLRRSSCAS